MPRKEASEGDDAAKSGVFKEELDPSPVARLCARVARRCPEVDGPSLEQAATAGLGPLALKARVAHVADALRAHLDPDGPTMLARLEHIAAAEPGDPVTPEALSGFLAWPVISVVERHGLPWPERSLAALERLTPTFSAEFAVRPFLRRYPELTLARLREWTTHPDEHVRRLVSEGTRPRLPWGGRLRAFQADPSPTLPLLEALRFDESLYVRRSVANHLNDISKDHPDLCVSLLQRWNLDPGDTSRRDHTEWITRHALRSLVKAGHPGALALQGFAPPRLDRVQLTLSPAVLELGGSLELEVVLSGPVAQDLVVDLVVYLVKARGERSPKVFKGRRLHLPAGETVTFTKALPLRPVSTRRYHAGEHAVQLRINGRDTGPLVPFELRL